MSTLANIRTKVRRLTRSPSTSQISDVDIDTYVNDFILYDIPEHLRLFTLKRTHSFVCLPFRDTYTTDANAIAADLNDFQNTFITVHAPVYIDGQPAYFSQDRTEFFAQYPLDQSITSIATGDGVTTNYTGTLSDIPVNRNSVLFTSVDANNGGLALEDDGAGNIIDVATGAATAPASTINYVTGVFDINFPAAPGNSESVDAHTYPYTAQRPDAVLYYANEFILRPIPDKPYRIQFDAYERPTSLINAADEPELEQWWQYIAYGAAKKIFEDRSDLDSVQQIMPEFLNQQLLVQRRTLVQQAAQRASTIYEYQTGLSAVGEDFRSGDF